MGKAGQKHSPAESELNAVKRIQRDMKQGQAQALENDGQESNEAARTALVFLPGWVSDE